MKIHERRYFNLLARELPLPHELVLMCIPTAPLCDTSVQRKKRMSELPRNSFDDSRWQRYDEQWVITYTGVPIEIVNTFDEGMRIMAEWKEKCARQGCTELWDEFHSGEWCVDIKWPNVGMINIRAGTLFIRHAA